MMAQTILSVVRMVLMACTTIANELFVKGTAMVLVWPVPPTKVLPAHAVPLLAPPLPLIGPAPHITTSATTTPTSTLPRATPSTSEFTDAAMNSMLDDLEMADVALEVRDDLL